MQKIDYLKKIAKDPTIGKSQGARLLVEKGFSPNFHAARSYIKTHAGSNGKEYYSKKNKVTWRNKYNTPKGFPKVLLFDLEVAPMKVLAWRIHKENINPTFILEDKFILTWSAKYLFDDHVINAGLTKAELKKKDDFRIVKELWELFDEADILVAHNLKGYDERMSNTRFIENGLLPPSPYRTIDTLISARKHFKFSSNKLDYINQRLGLNKKIQTDLILWKRCVADDHTAIQEMQIYNDKDVSILEELYLILRPWIKPHPNIGVFMDKKDAVCVYCGSKSIKPMNKEYTTNVGKFNVFKCNDCGGYSRGRTTSLDKDIKKYLNAPIGR